MIHNYHPIVIVPVFVIVIFMQISQIRLIFSSLLQNARNCP